MPGLYFAGAPTVISIGPSARFVAGTFTLSALLAKSAARRARGDAKDKREQVPAQVS